MTKNNFTTEQIIGKLKEAEVLFSHTVTMWENGYIESFNGKLRDELLNRGILYTLQEVKILIEKWRIENNKGGLHSALGYRPPAPRAVVMPAFTVTLLSRFYQGLT